MAPSVRADGATVTVAASTLWSMPQPDALADVTGCYWPFYGEGADAWQAQPSYGMSRVRVCVCVCVIQV